MRSRAGLGLGFCLLVIGVTPAAGQSFSIGLKGGATVANLQIVATDSTLDPRYRAGLVAGVFAGHDFGGGFGVQIEGLLSQKGTTIRDPRFDGDLDVKLTYLDVPVLARYRLRLSQGTSLHFLAGPVFSLRVADSQSIGGTDLGEDEGQAFTTGDLGLSIGGAVELGKAVIDVRYAWGISNINDDIDRDELIVRTRTFGVTVGWRWR